MQVLDFHCLPSIYEEVEIKDLGSNRRIIIPDKPHPDLIPSLLTFDSYRLDSLGFHGNSLLPDPLNASLEKFFLFSDSNKNLLGIFSFFLMGLGLGISLYLKKNRTEVLVFLVFIIGIMLFYSTYYATYIGQIERYMIPVLALFFMIIGFVIHRIWKISIGRMLNNQSKQTVRIFKAGLLTCFILVAGVVFLENDQIQGLLVSNVSFTNPVDLANRYPLEMLPEKSIIIENIGIRSLEYNAIHFNPGMRDWTLTDGEPDDNSRKLIEKLKNLMIQEYNVFVFKEPFHPTEPGYFRYIEKNNGLILKDYSETFCKMELIQDANTLVKTGIITDEVCYRTFE